MFQDQTLVTKFHRIMRLNLHQDMQGISAETENCLVSGFVAIPFVIFFPDSHGGQLRQIVNVYALFAVNAPIIRMVYNVIMVLRY